MIKENSYDIYSFFNIEEKLVQNLKQMPIDLNIEITKQKGQPGLWYTVATFNEIEELRSLFYENGNLIIDSGDKIAQLLRPIQYPFDLFRTKWFKLVTLNRPMSKDHVGTILSISNDGVARLSDFNGKYLAYFNHDKPVNTAVFNQNGNKVLTTSTDHTAKLWHLNGNLISTFMHEYPVHAAVFNMHDDLILTVSHNTAGLWDFNTNLITTVKHKRIFSAIFNCRLDRKEDKFLTISEDKAKLWDLHGQLITTFRNNDVITSAYFNNWRLDHQDDRVLIISENYIARLWDISGNLISTFGSVTEFNTLIFNPKSDKVLTILHDNTAKLWKLYEYLILEQVLLKKLISLYLISEKPSLNIITVENLLESISDKFKLNYEELEIIWKSFPKDVSRSLLISIERFIKRFGKNLDVHNHVIGKNI